MGRSSCTRSRQEIEELRRRCNKGENTLTQHRLDEHSLQQKRDPDAVSQHMTQFKDFQDKVNFLSDAREFHALDSRSSSGRSHVPNQPRVVSSSTRQPSRDSGVPRNTRDDLSIRGNVCEDILAQVHPKEFFEIQRIWRHHLRGQPVTTIPIRCFQRRARCKSHEGGKVPFFDDWSSKPCR